MSIIRPFFMPLFSERGVLLTRRTLVHFLLSLTFLSTQNFFFFFGFFSFFSCTLFSCYGTQRSKILEHRYFSESSVHDLDHRLRQNFNIALELTKLNTSKQHLIKFILNESSAGIIIDHKEET
jgi:hypothetical protein